MSDKTTPMFQQTVAMSEFDQAMQAQREQLRRRMAQDDARRAASSRIEVVALTSFTVVDDDTPEGRVIRAGALFEMAEHDLAHMSGKVRLASLGGVSNDAAHVRGMNS